MRERGVRVGLLCLLAWGVPGVAAAASVHVDARGIGDSRWFFIAGRDSYPRDVVLDIDLAPGSYALGIAGGQDTMAFDVTAEGTVAFAATLDGIFGGRGTSTLALSGAIAVTIDAPGIGDSPAFSVSSFDSYVRDQRVTLHVIPNFYQVNIAGGSEGLRFEVRRDATVDYDPALDGILSGRGTSRLELGGAGLRLHARSGGHRRLRAHAGRAALRPRNGHADIRDRAGQHAAGDQVRRRPAAQRGGMASERRVRRLLVRRRRVGLGARGSARLTGHAFAAGLAAEGTAQLGRRGLPLPRRG